MYPEKSSTFTFCFFDNTYSFKLFTIYSLRIRNFFLGSFFLLALLLFIFCGVSVCLMVCRTVPSNFSCCFSWCCTFHFWFSERCFTVFILPLLEEMLSKSFSKIICLLRSSCNKNSYCFQAVQFSHQAPFYGKCRNCNFVCHFYLYFVLHQKVLVLWTWVPHKRKSWSWWILRIGYLSAREVLHN